MSVPCRKISYPTRGHANKELRRIAKEGSHWPAQQSLLAEITT